VTSVTQQLSAYIAKVLTVNTQVKLRLELIQSDNNYTLNVQLTIRLNLKAVYDYPMFSWYKNLSGFQC